ncbi:MAG: serine/threonine protein kinase [Ruminococcaceae bacterium]|nr:serine/threonine protein kinase [Oscillospiraceae bacterium]
MLEVGSLVDGKYKILNKVGQGGMSVVYLAMNERANKQWAVKEVRKDGVLDFESVKQGLVAETDILKRLSHPHLPSIVDVIDTDDSFIIIMDYVQGNSLDKALKEFGAQPQEEVIEWSKQLCDVLGYLHTRQPAIIYRDMKPANVMLKPDGNISLIDFGTAREHKASKVEDTTCLGTRGYAAPEQYGGMGQTDARTDIYCLGATIYHLVTGMNPSQPPYEIRPITEINPALSTGLEKIITKCTQNNPADRYQSCAELMYDLEHYKDFEDEHIRQQRNKLKLFVSSVALTVVFAAVSVWALLSGQAAKSADYDVRLGKADNVQAYYDTILVDPTRTEAYIGIENTDTMGLIDFLIDDGELSADDNKVLSTLSVALDDNSGKYTKSVDVLEKLKDSNPEGYKQVCYEIGETYIFYYNVGVEKDKYQAASTWLKETVDDYPVAKIYCDISSSLQNIDKYVKAEQTAKLYEEFENLWGEVETLHDEVADSEDDLKIHVWNAIVSMINSNCKEFCEVASKNELKSMLNKISAETKTITNTFLKDKIAELQSNTEITVSKIDTVKD